MAQADGLESVEQLSLESASTLAFQLLKIGKAPSVCQGLRFKI